MDFDEFLSCYFTFTVEGAQPDAYEALFAFCLADDARTYLVYTDAGDEGDFETYAAVAVDPDQLACAQAASDAGRAPQAPVVLDLAPLDDDLAVRERVAAAIQEVMDEEE